MLKQKHFAFKSRSHARQELDKLIKKGLISNYRISWDTQLRMKVEVKHTGSIANQEQFN